MNCNSASVTSTALSVLPSTADRHFFVVPCTLQVQLTLYCGGSTAALFGQTEEMSWLCENVILLDGEGHLPDMSLVFPGGDCGGQHDGSE